MRKPETVLLWILSLVAATFLLIPVVALRRDLNVDFDAVIVIPLAGIALAALSIIANWRMQVVRLSHEEALQAARFEYEREQSNRDLAARTFSQAVEVNMDLTATSLADIDNLDPMRETAVEVARQNLMMVHVVGWTSDIRLTAMTLATQLVGQHSAFLAVTVAAMTRAMEHGRQVIAADLESAKVLDAQRELDVAFAETSAAIDNYYAALQDDLSESQRSEAQAVLRISGAGLKE